MSSKPYKITWINEVKGYGMIATEDIPSGSEILQESAIYCNINLLLGIMNPWLENDTSRTALDESPRSQLFNWCKKMLDGWKELKEISNGNPDLDLIMRVHEERVNKSEIGHRCPEKDKYCKNELQIPMDLYKSVINIRTDMSEASIKALLEPSLLKINTCLATCAIIRQMDFNAWGLQTSMINHGCRPNATVACMLAPEDLTSQKLSAVIVRTIRKIEKGQEIELEYAFPFGMYKQRRDLLICFGIFNCLCSHCEEQRNLQYLAVLPDNEDALDECMQRSEASIYLYGVFQDRLLKFKTLDPVQFYHLIYYVGKMLQSESYDGDYVAQTLETAITYAKTYNDNVRVAYLTLSIMKYFRVVFGDEHPRTMAATLDHVAARQGTLWNPAPDRKSFYNQCGPFEWSREDDWLIFMLDQPESSKAYVQLAVDKEGRPYVVSGEENPALENGVSTLVGGQLPSQEKEEDDDDDDDDNEEEEEAAAAAAAIAAEVAAAELAAAEEAETAARQKKAEKAKAKKTKQKEKKKAAAAAALASSAAAAALVASRLAAAAAAVRAATVVPALPLLLPPPPPTQEVLPSSSSSPPAPPRGIRIRIRSRTNSDPERAVVMRFLRGISLRPVLDVRGREERDIDCVSEGG